MNIELELYKKMYLIRACENAIIKEYPNNQMRTPMHMSAGSEHIASAVCLALGDRAQVFSSYRSHASYLAQTEDTDQFFLEMYGRKESVIGGRGGSMHLCYPEKGFIMSSAIVASQISVACGYAWANKTKKNNKIVAVFFGDGAIEEGGFWESLNIACLYKLPIIFVLEDNGLAVHTSKDVRKGFNVKFEDFMAYDFFFKIDENPSIIVSTILAAVECDYFPFLLHCEYHRMLEHVGINEDYEVGYRIKLDYDFDPVKIQRERLVDCIGDAAVQSIVENDIDLRVQKSVDSAKNVGSVH